MDFALDESAQAIGELAAQVIGDASTHERLKQLETGDGHRFDAELWATLAETGVLGAFVPEAHGGAGLDLVALGAVLQAAGRHTAAVPLWRRWGSPRRHSPSSHRRSWPARCCPPWRTDR